jgi:O-antigen/teichoic acid export membrane protein
VEDRFGRDVAFLASVRLVGVAAGFLTSVLAARLLGPAELGVAGVAQTVGTIVALVANGGLSMSSIYLLRRPHAVTRQMAAALTGLSLISVAVAAVAGVLAAVAVGTVAVDGLLGATAIATGALAAATVAVDTFGAQLLGLGQSRRYTIAEGIRSLGTLLGVAVVLIVVTSAAGYALGLAAGMAVAAAYAIRCARRVTGSVLPAVEVAVWREALGYGLRGQFGNVLQYFTLRLDLVLVAAILGPAAAGIYLVAARVSEVVTQIANAAASLLFPAIAGRQERGSTEFTNAIVREVTILVAASSLGVGVSAWFWLPLVFGADYASALPALWLLLVAAIPLSIGRLLAGDLKGRGRPGLVSAVAVIGLVVMVVGDLLFLEQGGIEAAAVVSIVAYGANAAGLVLVYRAVTGASLVALMPTPADAVNIGRRVIAGARRPSPP